MNPVFKPICIVLKETRKNKGLSLEEAYKATKIHPHILRSLEDGTTLQLSDVYIKSYIKIYAKYLGIGDGDLDQYFRPISTKVKEKEERRFVSDLFVKAKKEKIKNLASRVSQMRLGLFLRVRMPHLKKIFAIILVVFILVTMVRIANNSRKKVSVVSTRRQSLSDTIPTAKRVPPKNVVTKKEGPPKELVLPSTSTVRLTLFALEDVWIQIKQDGLVVFKGILKKLSSETWNAQERFELRTNNAGAIKLELNGKILSPIGRKGQTLRKVAITKDGLKVE